LPLWPPHPRKKREVEARAAALAPTSLFFSLRRKRRREKQVKEGNAQVLFEREERSTKVIAILGKIRLEPERIYGNHLMLQIG
jgi:hypothetical protein